MSKIICSLFIGIMLLFSACNNNKNSKSSGAKNDSVEYKVHFTFTHPDPPYADYDTGIIVKFATENDFEWWAKHDTIHKSAERIK